MVSVPGPVPRGEGVKDSMVTVPLRVPVQMHPGVLTLG